MRTVLIANRGEIAVRIIRACRESGLESIAVYSDVDAGALHVRSADRAVRIGPASPAESYLSVQAIIDAALETGADAIHPGYGFLSERPQLPRACAEAGLTFIGPPADAMERMGSKIGARALMQAANVPVVPGATSDDQSDAGVQAAARRLGFPVLIKASAGGGGKGMRIVWRDADAIEAIGAARREAAAAFGDGTLYVERLIERPRHIEIQVFADTHGRVVHIFERECSAQRRHQKVIEESPSPALTPALRQRMGEAAIAAGKAVGYVNAGTIEFLLEGEGADARFYFLEMNTRLQVEHPVTESVAGIDLVRAQFAVAMGDPLPWTQEQLTQRGHAIECRIYAEDPAEGFLPQAGRLARYREPTGPGIRIDSGVVEGDVVSVHYDPLLAKLIASGETREAARVRAIQALRHYPVLGTRTNIPFLIKLLELPAFRDGHLHTGSIEEHLGVLTPPVDPSPYAVIAAASAGTGPRAGSSGAERAEASDDTDPWTRLARWGR
jgi:acetyl-CoA carboxylase biotin carboxylase subunit